ncbi:ABC transporter permease, partial [Bacillaceae bacterium Marseille-Q3522]|nr:ABC transporter permease [Bacillaceae bacterium Marseille-Q3522]
MSANSEQQYAGVPATTVLPKKRNPFVVWTKLLFRSKTGTVGLFIVLLAAIVAIFAPFLAPHDPIDQNPAMMLRPPIWMEGGEAGYFLGTDYLGRDIFSRIIYGSQVSLLVGIAAVIVAGLIGVVIGLIAGYYGGILDNVLMRIVDAFLAIPNILLILVVISVFGPSLFTLILVIGFTNWVNYAAIVRSEV